MEKVNIKLEQLSKSSLITKKGIYEIHEHPFLGDEHPLLILNRKTDQVVNSHCYDTQELLETAEFQTRWNM